MITNTTKKKVALFLREFLGAGTTKLGMGGGGTDANGIDLDVPLSTTADNSAISSDDKVLEIKSSFSGTSLQGYTVREVGFFADIATDTEMGDIETANFNMTGATEKENIMFARINFDAIGNFSTSDTIEVIYTMEVE